MIRGAWVRVGRATLAGHVTVRDLWTVLPAWTAPLLVATPMFSRDAYSYLAQGALLRDGFDPYEVGPVVNPGVLLDNVSNVWTTTTDAAARQPVLVYFYGGGFIAGDGSEYRYDGASMARRGITTVTVNYRLDVFGLLAHPELTKESSRGASGN